MDTSNKSHYKDTLNLPRTNFPIRSNPKVDDQAMLDRWEKEDLSTKTFHHNKGHRAFILMDGPPYANGPIHLGHAYNKILKDIVGKSQRMMGKYVPITPGWDCHGLPIELKVAQANPDLGRSELKKACRIYATGWINAQMTDFKKLGIQFDWQRPYTTMDFDYEANTLRAFGILVKEGYIERKNKTVPWCYSCKTVLATAEIEYQERKDPSLYVLFRLTDASVQRVLPQLYGQAIDVAIWTTTPWTLLLNQAVVLKPATIYVVLEIGDKKIIVAKVLAEKLCNMLQVPVQVVAEFSTDSFNSKELLVHNPLLPKKIVPIILDNNVLLEDGTACVHNAPGAGPEDYEIGIKNGLDIYSPVGPDGTMTGIIEPQELQGMSVDDVQIWVFKKLAQQDTLLHKTSLRHSYPHCWRCHKGLIFRATKQWFCNLLHHQLKQRALNAIDSIEMFPAASHNRFKSTIEGRLEWCLSRQRVWGTPITALCCNNCDHVYINEDFIATIAEGVDKEGIEYWDTVPLSEIMPTGLQCAACGGKSFKKEQDILDVWLESGISHFAVLKKNPELGFPADMFLEGKDQHRAYFQSSLLTSMAINNESCMKTIVTHGFTVDQNGRKMSKSIGNVISPHEIIEEIGTDCLRLWTASIDCAGEAVVSEILLKNVQEVFRKIRNTCRFLLSNLYDFDKSRDAISLDALRAIDLYALNHLAAFNKKVINYYNHYDFTAVFHALGDYCSVELSAFYLDIIKDRLYVEQSDGLARRSAQTVCWYIVDTLTKLMAPILSFTAEQIADHYQPHNHLSIHLQSFADLTDVEQGLNSPIIQLLTNEKIWQIIKNMRSVLLKALEEKRAAQVIKHSLEARVIVSFNGDGSQQENLQEFFTALEKNKENKENFFKELLIVSQFIETTDREHLTELSGGFLYGTIQQAQGSKCLRCWQWQPDVIQNLCKRCQHILDK